MRLLPVMASLVALAFGDAAHDSAQAASHAAVRAQVLGLENRLSTLEDRLDSLRRLDRADCPESRRSILMADTALGKSRVRVEHLKAWGEELNGQAYAMAEMALDSLNQLYGKAEQATRRCRKAK